ncbi:ThuA domain-containing protein [Chryseolinea lacunae]|uniref:ThuA domain-containing protein n=1 Tax=Chryseolinea lacunae TaxID=2801331 RepID=A0ABS1KKV0_9BACT|nr:ThuA domain-containing protein [Chryseolinea lacunae]MBL0739847.1 ThuA domain-containing protein [Chryseolinea lacunae]
MRNVRVTFLFLFCFPAVFFCATSFGQTEEHPARKIKVFVIGATDKYHSPMVDKSEPMFRKLAAENNLDIHFTRDTAEVNTLNLSGYQVFIQLSLAPFDMSTSQQYAIQEFISRGKGWIGVHAAGLIGNQFEQRSRSNWKWYGQLLGGASYTPHPPLQDGVVKIENGNHPITKGLPITFTLRDEWYEFDKAPAHANILAVADEATYKPKVPMGYHPVVWTNPEYDRVVYISVGHDSTSCTNVHYTKLLQNAIAWAAENEGKEQKQLDAFLKSDASILTNQIGYNTGLPKRAMFRSNFAVNADATFTLSNALTLEEVYSGKIQKSAAVKDWNEYAYSTIDFSDFNTPGFYTIRVSLKGKSYQSFDFEIGSKLLTRKLVPAIANFFECQKANSKEELMGDEHVKLFGSEKTVDLRGGWCDASGDVSKYFSHLAYTNFMNPQQTPLVDWSMIQTVEAIPEVLNNTKVKDSLVSEAFYGADYIMKSLSPEGYFYMTLFSYFKKDPKERRVVGLLADSKTTSDYQSGFREGGGMGVAALARISQWKQKSKYEPVQYLQAAERAFDHLQKNSVKYVDDHKENILDDYTALMAGTELWIATKKPAYQKEARRRAQKLEGRLSPEGFFWSNDEKTRPFWHASDAGLPVLSLIRYLDVESDKALREKALTTIKKFIDYQLKVSNEVANPFQYPRQTFRLNNKIQNGFFIPHENESGWWWQGENARVGSLATVLLRGGRLVYPEKNVLGVRADIATYVCGLMDWVLGNNPYQLCMMYGYGQVNVPYMAAMYGHGSGRGGISNGITGAEDKADGSGIAFKYEDNGNEWRWSEQWIPHTAWFMQALTALESK